MGDAHDRAIGDQLVVAGRQRDLGAPLDPVLVGDAGLPRVGADVLAVGCEPTMPLPGPTTPPPGAATGPTVSTPPGDAPAPDAPPRFGIGGGEDAPDTHVAFEAPRDLIAASARVVVDRVAPRGLNFFALQVDFANGSWAHGGGQDVDRPDGARTRQVNWGGLVDRGGGTADYDEMDDVAALARIQNLSLIHI